MVFSQGSAGKNGFFMVKKDTGGIGYIKFQETKARFFKKSGPSLPWYETADLETLLTVEANFLKWYPATKSPEKEEKKRIYETYIKPRIALLQGKGIQATLF